MTKVFEHKDSSGRITIAVFREQATVEQAHFHDFATNVDIDLVAIGGGVEAAETPEGALITASYPSPNRWAWLGSSKDHNHPNPHLITVYAIGMKIEGLSRDALMSNLRFFGKRSDVAPHPAEEASVPPGFLLIGGGFRINWPPGTGNMATASFPDSDSTWKVRSKDHFTPSPCTIDAFSVGLRSSIDGLGTFERRVTQKTSRTAAHPFISFSLDDRFALTGIGAEVNFNEPGSLLWKLIPGNGGSQGITAASKDHEVSSPANIDAFAIGIKLAFAR
ncbi:MAG: hypothetical protein JWP48_1237 [Actinoallomurus sp.]|jgi:hypothetical protein|nr:hypothetical protein [Actinoallomurus sp.]